MIVIYEYTLKIKYYFDEIYVETCFNRSFHNGVNLREHISFSYYFTSI